MKIKYNSKHESGLALRLNVLNVGKKRCKRAKKVSLKDWISSMLPAVSFSRVERSSSWGFIALVAISKNLRWALNIIIFPFKVVNILVQWAVKIFFIPITKYTSNTSFVLWWLWTRLSISDGSDGTFFEIFLADLIN